MGGTALESEVRRKRSHDHRDTEGFARTHASPRRRTFRARATFAQALHALSARNAAYALRRRERESCDQRNSRRRGRSP